MSASKSPEKPLPAGGETPGTPDRPKGPEDAPPLPGVDDGISARELWRRAWDYFARCDRERWLYGEAGLALAAGVPLETLRRWYDGEERGELRGVTRWAYLRIQAQIEADPRYREHGMVSRSLFLNKQPRLGGYQERGESGGRPLTVRVRMGENMDETDFQ